MARKLIRAARELVTAPTSGAAGSSSVVFTAGTIAAAASGNGEITITQTDAPSGGSGGITLKLYRHTASFTPPGTGTEVSTSLPYEDTGLDLDTTYYYEVVYTSGSLTVNSNEVNATTAAEIEPLIDEQFSYTSTANMLADPNGWYATFEDVCDNGCDNSASGKGEIHLDNTQSGPTSSSGKCMLYTHIGFPAGAVGGTISRRFPLPVGCQEVWVELEHKFDTGWTTENGITGGDAAYKFFDVTINGAAGRYDYGFQGGDTGAFSCQQPGGDEDIDNDVSISTVRGDWRTWRFHVKNSTSRAMRAWLDGVLKLELTGFSTTATELDEVTLAQNINKQPLSDQNSRWGRVRIYTTDPEW